MNNPALQLRQLLMRDPRSTYEICQRAELSYGGSFARFMRDGSTDFRLSTAIKIADAIDCDIVLIPRYDGK